jgi:Zn-dependent alcohol dehydrogenase
MRRVLMAVVPHQLLPSQLRIAAFGFGFQTGAGAIINVVNPSQTKSRTLAIFGVAAVGFLAVFATKSNTFFRNSNHCNGFKPLTTQTSEGILCKDN